MELTTEKVVYRHAHLKAIDPIERAIEAVLTTEAVDLQREVVLSRGVRFRSPLPMLVGHHPDKLAGTWDAPYPVTVDGVAGWAAKGRFGRSALAEETYRDVLDGHLSGCSIGFHVDEKDDRPVVAGQTGPTFRRILVIEASLTPVPACSQCYVTAKAIRPVPAPLTLDRATLTRLVRAEIERAVDVAMPSITRGIDAAFLHLRGKVD